VLPAVQLPPLEELELLELEDELEELEEELEDELLEELEEDELDELLLDELLELLEEELELEELDDAPPPGPEHSFTPPAMRPPNVASEHTKLPTSVL
jgi:hypothetical protein